MLNALLSRWTRTRTASPSLLGRSTAYPPSPRYPRERVAGDSLWQSLLRLIPGEPDPWNTRPLLALPESTLPAARAEFQAGLDGVHSDSADDLLRSIRRARSLRDLWHLRTWLYTEVARAHSQHEAEQRLARLNTHFTGATAIFRRH